MIIKLRSLRIQKNLVELRSEMGPGWTGLSKVMSQIGFADGIFADKFH